MGDRTYHLVQLRMMLERLESRGHSEDKFLPQKIAALKFALTYLAAEFPDDDAEAQQHQQRILEKRKQRQDWSSQ
jgi:hypothetical protein